MNYEERQKQLCAECHKRNENSCAYVSRGLQSKCSYLQDVMSGWEYGQRDAIDSLWHDCKELPDEGRNVLVSTMSPKGVGVMEGGVTVIGDRGLITCDCKGVFKKWAYLDEILPKIE